MRRKIMLWGGLGLPVILAAVALAACTGTPTGTVTASNCTECHNDTTQVLVKRLQWDSSLHGSGDAYLRSTSASCAGCHSGEGFIAMIAAGNDFSEVKAGVANPSPPNCRTCHQIHENYTQADWALTATAPVNFFIGGTYDAGTGNLCANCHQPRRTGPTAGSGDVVVDSNRWGPHHGVQATSFLGVGGYGVEGSPSVHYQAIEDGCTTCHLVEGRHEMTSSVASCQPCHSGIEDFDYNGVQTDVTTMIAKLKGLLETKGLLLNDQPVPGTYPDAQAGAIWNYLAVTEDGSFGVHNPPYLQALLQESIDALK